MSAGVRLVVMLGLVIGLVHFPSSTANAYVCGNFAIDCTWPDISHPDCPNPPNPPHTTPRSTFVSGLGSLELRYDDGCRTIWARAPQAAGTDVWLHRTCGPSGNTLGKNTQVNGTKVFSQQLNDAGLTGQAAVLWGGVGYFTGSY